MKKNLSLLVASIALLFVSCGGPIKTGSATEVTHSSAVLHGELNVALDQPIEFGVVIAESEEALINSTDTFKFIVTEHKEGVFELPLNRFIPETDYYYYAWIVKDGETLVGETKNFTTSSAPTATFSIGEAKKVAFSLGNLQYHVESDTWCFASSQLEFIGRKNANIDYSGSGIIDLFGWGTGSNPTTTRATKYGDYDEFVDWGTNKIGDDAPNTWRTLAVNEWNYIFNKRENARSMYGVAAVDGVNGMIILPDGWNNPLGLPFKSGMHKKEGVKYYAIHQTIEKEQWEKMEKAGAIFLPAAGHRSPFEGEGFEKGKELGQYWASTREDFYFWGYEIAGGNAFTFNSSEKDPKNSLAVCQGISVRLVKDVE
jgi:hypothetical protein